MFWEVTSSASRSSMGSGRRCVITMRWSNGTVTVRVYAELNDHLPLPLCYTSFDRPLPLGCTVKDLVEALGIPRAEVDLVLVNGEPADWTQHLVSGDRVSIYPVFESIDISPVQRLRPRPLREPRFICDVHLGRLARYLRLLGFDTRYDRRLDDATLAACAASERRILLTRDRELLKRRAVTHGYWIRAVLPREQLLEVVRRFDLARYLQPFTRCPRCNGILEQVEREAVRGKVPPRSWARAEAFWHCSGCGQVYWYGTHCERVEELVGWVRQASSMTGSPAAET